LYQKKHDKNKVYSLHEPGALCIAKGKAHKKYEFGRKASIAMLRDSGVIVSAVSFDENLYDGDTLSDTLALAQTNSGKRFASMLVDNGYRGRPEACGVKIEPPARIRKTDTPYEKRKRRKRFARRSAIEPVIGHLKSDHRLARCFLKGSAGSAINLGLAAAAWNLKIWLREVLLALFRHLLHLAQTPCPTPTTTNQTP